MTAETDDITIRHCWEQDNYHIHGWYIDECPKCLERRLVEEIDTLRKESTQRIADLEAQADDLEKQIKEYMRARIAMEQQIKERVDE